MPATALSKKTPVSAEALLLELLELLELLVIADELDASTEAGVELIPSELEASTEEGAELEDASAGLLATELGAALLGGVDVFLSPPQAAKLIIMAARSPCWKYLFIDIPYAIGFIRGRNPSARIA